MSPLDRRKSLASVKQNHLRHYIMQGGHIFLATNTNTKVGKCGIISVIHNVIHTTRALKCKPSALNRFQGSCPSYTLSNFTVFSSVSRWKKIN